MRKPDPHEATLLLRELAESVNRLEGPEKKRAQRILARPSDGESDPQGHGYQASTTPQHVCTTQTNDKTGEDMELCFHWVNTTDDAPLPADASPANSVPDYIDNQVIPKFDQVWETEINDMGYRSPVKDGGLPDGEGPSDGLDIYLADVGEDGIYGYCTNDNPTRSSRSQSAYCVIDNDFAQSDFAPNVHGEDALKITGAHEFFHAVQFAYDWREQLFFMEGTAVWMEDEVFNEVNANYEYLHDSALHQPEVPLDAGDIRPDENFEYGSWLFWRFLSERFSRADIRKVWQKAPTKTVFAALRPVLSGHNSNLAEAYADFAEWNRVIDAGNFGLANYEEGIPYMAHVNFRYPPTDAEFWLGPTRPSTGNRRLQLDHLSMRYVLIQPFANAKNGTKLKVNVDTNDVAGARARLVRLLADDLDPDPENFDLEWCAESQPIRLDRNGAGAKTVSFKPGRCGGENRDFTFVYLTLVNGGFKDNARFDYSARTIKP